jgi:CubicO group peptidase (beta-lactamase class C family)
MKFRAWISWIALATWTACSASDPPSDPRFEPLAAAVLQDLATSNATAASVAVWLDGEVIWVGGFGHADPDGAAPPDEDTLFMIGSDTKKIAALSLLRKVAAGKTTLDTTVAALLPDLMPVRAPDFPGATLRELLSHQGGIADGVETTTSTTDAALASYTYGEFSATYHSMAPPGIFWNYSNPNFSIAGLIDQQLDGRMWADIVEEDLFRPLGMTRTVARKSEVDANHAPGLGHTASDPTLRRVGLADTWEAAFTRPAGLVWSTPGDQIRLARFLVDGDPAVLDPALLREVTRSQVRMYPELPFGYGFGLITRRGIKLEGAWYDVEVWSHGGNTMTHTSTFFVLPEQRFAISILSNGVNDNFSVSVATAMTTLVALPPPGVAPAIPFDPSQLDALTGTYTDPAGIGEIIVTREGDALAVAVPTFDAAGVPYQRALTAISTRVWIAHVNGSQLEVTFIDGPGGETYLRNRNLVAVRPP